MVRQPGLFIIDTKPPEGYIEFDGAAKLTNSREQVLNVYFEDESTGVQKVQLREKSAEGMLTVGRLTTATDTAAGDATPPPDPCDFTNVKVLGHSLKVPWTLDDISGMRGVEALLTDYGGNNSCQTKNQSFMSLFEHTATLNDMLIVKELVEELNGTTATTVDVESVYVCSEDGSFYSLSPYSRLLYSMGKPIRKIATLDGEIYLFTYETDGTGKMYRHDRLDNPTLITSFSSAMSSTTATVEWDGMLYIGMSNGELWRYDGSAVTLLRTFSASISSVHADTNNLYIGFATGMSMFIYNGQSFTEVELEA